MKKVCAIISLIIFSCQPSFSQDWQSVRTGASQVYSGPPDVYTYNLKGIRIDTSYNLDGVTHLKNLSSVGSDDGNCFSPFGNSWIGREVISYPTGDNYFINYNGDSLLVRTLGMMGESWVFLKNQLLNLELRASIISLAEDTFLGLTDSVKVIELQAFDLTGNAKSHALNGTQLILSKNYGLIQLFEFFATPRQTYYFPEKIYNLVGMTDPILGVQNLEYSQIYNFEIGDEFHTLADDYYTSGSAWDTTQTISYVIDKAISATGDSVTYTFFRKWRNVSFVGPELYWLNLGQDTDLVTYSHVSDNAIQFLKLPGEAMVFQSGPTQSYIKDAAQGPSQLYNGRQVKEDPSGGNVHYLGTWGDSCFQYFAWGYPDLARFGHYVEGCGGPYWDEYAYHFDNEYKLVYFRKGSETWGIPFDTSLWEGIRDDVASQNQFSVYPNPTSDQLTIEFPQWTNGECSISIISVLGQTFTRQSIESDKLTISLIDYPPGVYVLRVFQNNQILGQKKFIKL
jgi:hypothetical protein